ncbi:peptide/nickel transport system permease protein [Neorhizobium huautlense]|uniref:Peptide/nickel transport system permease protein n=1 Tax=Neorhizobium huautlense TaxID=67774 RepID=A0ABT9PT56_9HYPH|nr:ABC transporter permease [Neorhizobium huautlense]MDP9837064.1 peptide/nickel transport system permease protein [Neorhizobium huautlense]
MKTLLRNRKALVGLAIIATIAILAIAAPLLTEYNPATRTGRPHQAPSMDHILGTTRIGQDVFARVLYGARTSLMVGFGAGLLITLVGTVLGIVAGYRGGKTDEVISFFTNMVLVVPNLPLLLVLAAFIGQASPVVIALILGATSWAWGARVTRAETLSVKQKDFVKSAEMMGERQWRIMAFEIFPNVISIVGINFIGSVIFAIITQATLEFLGLGDPRAISWGNMLFAAQKASALSVGAWWEILTPCFALAFLGIGMSLLNFAVDEIANPRLRTGNRLGRWSLLVRNGEGRL